MRKRPIVDGNLVLVTVLALAAAGGVWLTEGGGRVVEILVRDTAFALALLPKIVAGVIIATSLPLLISRERIRRLVGPEAGLWGLTIAAAAGAALPGGPTVTYPLALGLLAAGADFGAAVALTSGWMLLGLNRTLIWELSFLPYDIVALRYVLSLAPAVLLGLLARRVPRHLVAAE